MKVAWNIALYNVVFHQLPLIQHCSISYKKNAFQSTKHFRRIQWQNMLRMASECISYNLEFQNFQGEDFLPERGKTPLSGSPPLAPAELGLCLGHSTLPLLYKLRLLLQFFLRTLDSSPGQVKEPNYIGGGGGSVMVSMLASSVVDRGFESWSDQRTKLHQWWW